MPFLFVSPEGFTNPLGLFFESFMMDFSFQIPTLEKTPSSFENLKKPRENPNSDHNPYY